MSAIASWEILAELNIIRIDSESDVRQDDPSWFCIDGLGNENVKSENSSPVPQPAGK